MPFDPRHRSRNLLDGRDRAPARSMLKAIGYDDAALAKPIIGVADGRDRAGNGRECYIITP